MRNSVARLVRIVAKTVCFRPIVVVVGSMFVLGVAQSSHAQTFGPFPPPLGAYFWMGPQDGSGDGSAADWDNWTGRYNIIAGSPPTIQRLPPINGDALFINHDFNHANTPHTVSLGGLDLPNSFMQFSYYATFSGGSLTLDSVSIRSDNGVVGATFPVTFQGTSFDANSMDVFSENDTITLNNVTVATAQLTLRGGYSLDPVNFPPPGGTPIANFNGATINASVVQIFNSFDVGSYVVNVADSHLSSLGTQIGVGASTIDNAAQLHLTRTQATFDQFLVVGSEGAGKLTVDDNSTISVPTGYVNVGDVGQGSMTISDSSTATIHEFNVGGSATGDVGIDTGASVTADTVTVGVISGIEGTINIETGGALNTTDLTVGDSGTGYIYVRDGGTLKVDGDAVLGHNPGSRGVLNLIGSDAHLDLGVSSSLTIGDQGAGELRLEEGAQFTLAGDVVLGQIAGSSGTVTATGQDSKWTIGGNLTIGEHGVGSVEIHDQATLKVNGGKIVLGKEADGDGTLVIDGDGSTLDFNGQLIVASAGKGTFIVQNGASFSTGTLALGNYPQSSGGPANGSATLTVDSGTLSANQILGLDYSTITVTNSNKLGIVLGAGGTFDLGGSADHPAMLTVENNGLVSVDSSGNAQFRAGSTGKAIVNVTTGGRIQVSDIQVGSPDSATIGGSSLTITGSTSQISSATLVVHTGATLTTLAGGQALAANSAIVNGTVDVQDGSLLVGSLPTSPIQSGAVTVTPGGVLAGSGVIKGSLLALGPTGFSGQLTGGRITPGNSPGLLTVDGDVDLEPGAVLEMQIGGLTAGKDYDVLDVQGTAHIKGSLVLEFIDGFAPVAGDQFTLLTVGELDAAPVVTVRDLAPGWTYEVVETNRTLTIVSLDRGVFVPEPAPAWMLLSGLPALVLYCAARWRRNLLLSSKS